MLQKFFLSAALAIFSLSGALALQIDSYYVGKVEGQECHILFIVLSDDDGRYIASGYAKIGTGCAPAVGDHPSGGFYYYDDPQSPGFVAYLIANPEVQYDLNSHINANYGDYLGGEGTLLGLNHTNDDVQGHRIEVEMAPNPAMGYVEFVLAGFDEPAIPIRIYNVAGALVKSETVTNADKVTITRMNLTGLPGGTYVVKLGEKNQVQRKLEILK